MKNLIQDINTGESTSAYVKDVFSIGFKTLKENNYRLISLEENAKLRMQKGKDAYCSKHGNWVQEDFIYIPKKGVYLTKNYSPICDNVEEATTSHTGYIDEDLDGIYKEFYLTYWQVERALSNSIFLSKNALNYNIPTTDFKNNEITNFAFGKYAEDYGRFLKEAGINKMSIKFESKGLFVNWFANLKEGKPLARKVLFGGIGIFGNSTLNGKELLCWDWHRSRGLKK